MERFEYAFISSATKPTGKTSSLALADVFDIGVNACGIEGQAVADAFVASALLDNSNSRTRLRCRKIRKRAAQYADAVSRHANTR